MKERPNPDLPAGSGSETPSGSEPESAPEPGSAPEPEVEPTPLISFKDFARVQLKVARIVEVELHPNADRLLKLQIDLGEERRQIIAGIAGAYTPEDLLGRSIVVVANLKPAKLRGEISQGMLLAAVDGEVLSILTPDQEISPGTEVG